MTNRVIIKDHACIHSGTLINSMGGLYIGKNTGIGYNCTIFTTQHRYRNAKTIPFDNVVELKPVIIRDYVWLGAGVIIMPGIELGEGSIIGMGSVVTKNVLLWQLSWKIQRKSSYTEVKNTIISARRRGDFSLLECVLDLIEQYNEGE